MRLLVTRPEPDNERTARELRELGHDVLLAPVLRVEPVADADLGAGPWAAALITSANGARAAAAHTRRAELIALPVFAVGDRSAEAARYVGFREVTSASGASRDLVRKAGARFIGSMRPLIYLAGEDRARNLAGEMGAFGVAVHTAVIYRTVAATGLPPAVAAALGAGEVDGVLHFSRRSVENYLACAAGMLDRALKPIHFCLSARTAEPLTAAGAADVRIAGQPDEEALLALVTP